MHHLRCNVAGALVAILFVAVGFAALREADELWDSWLFSSTLGLLLVAVLLAAPRTGDRRAFWIGFALFGWGYLSFSLIPSTEPRLISTKALAYLHQANILGIRPYAYRMRAILDLDCMRAYNVSPDDVRMIVNDHYMNVSPAQLGQATGSASQNVEDVLSWGSRSSKTDWYERIVLKATPEGEVVRLKDVAKVERGSSFYSPRVGAETSESFIHVGHTLFSLLAAWLGGVLSRRFRVAPIPT